MVITLLRNIECDRVLLELTLDRYHEEVCNVNSFPHRLQNSVCRWQWQAFALGLHSRECGFLLSLSSVEEGCIQRAVVILMILWFVELPEHDNDNGRYNRVFETGRFPSPTLSNHSTAVWFKTNHWMSCSWIACNLIFWRHIEWLSDHCTEMTLVHLGSWRRHRAEKVESAAWV